MTLVERLKRKFTVNESGCWVFGGMLNRDGYGVAYADGKWLAHRLSYVLFVGEIPSGMTLDHLCRNRACINPAHLEVVTLQENILRGMHPNMVLHREARCKKNHPIEGNNVSRRDDGRPRCRTCVNEMARTRRRLL